MDITCYSRAELGRLIDRLDADRQDLRAVNAALQAEISELRAQVAELQAELAQRGPADPTTPARPPGWLKPNKPGRVSPRSPRKRRAHGASRKRATTPTQVVRHVVGTCPGCGCGLQGGSVKRHREIIEIALPPATVTDHQLVQRVCPQCAQVCVPTLTATDGVVGRHRLGPNLLALIATWHEEARMPVEVIQAQLATLFGVRISVGAIVGALHTVAARGATDVAAIHAAVVGSPVVHSDETTWREDGENCYSWLLATPTARYFTAGRRTNAMIDSILGEAFAGVLVVDFYAAYDHFPGEKQRCWAHLLRDARDVLAQYPHDRLLLRWVRNLRRLFRVARDSPAHTRAARLAACTRLEAATRRLCEPCVGREVPQRTLCQRILKYLPELYTCVRLPGVPPTNNEAERGFRPLVTGRKISGGTRSAQGTKDAMARAALFRTWHARGLNPFQQARALLLSPQL